MAAIMKTSDARSHFADLLNAVGVKGDRILLERHGKKLVAMVPVEDLELLERLEDELDLREARKAKRGGRISLADLKSELKL